MTHCEAGWCDTAPCRNANGKQKLEGVRTGSSPGSPDQGQPCPTLDSSRWGWDEPSGPRDCRIKSYLRRTKLWRQGIYYIRPTLTGAAQTASPPYLKKLFLSLSTPSLVDSMNCVRLYLSYKYLLHSFCYINKKDKATIKLEGRWR